VKHNRHLHFFPLKRRTLGNNRLDVAHMKGCINPLVLLVL
jgi:hypothetical protein